ncbi:hypothetical protein AVEN_270997-1, partial [Araneus ventricosus]
MLAQLQLVAEIFLVSSKRDTNVGQFALKVLQITTYPLISRL